MLSVDPHISVNVAEAALTISLLSAVSNSDTAKEAEYTPVIKLSPILCCEPVKLPEYDPDISLRTIELVPDTVVAAVPDSILAFWPLWELFKNRDHVRLKKKLL